MWPCADQVSACVLVWIDLRFFFMKFEEIGVKWFRTKALTLEIITKKFFHQVRYIL